VQTPKKTTPVRSDLRAKAVLPIEPQPPLAVDDKAVADGRKPLAPRRKDVAEIRARAIELYGVAAAGFVPIDGAFQFSQLESDADFHFLHVEPLLEQAAVLLDRCVAAAAQYEKLQAEKWDFQLELDRFLRLDAIAERELAAGRDTLPYERTVRESGAEASIESNYKSAEEELKGFTEELLTTGLNRRIAARELTAWVTAYPLKDEDLRGDDASYVFDGVSKTKPDHLFEAARLEADEAAWDQIAELMARRFASLAATQAGKLRKESLDLEAKWSLADIVFRREKSQADRDAFWERVYHAQRAGGLLNYSERIPAIERDFSRDFREALARLTAIRRGLKEVYNYSPAFPQEGSAGYFDQVTMWVKNARDRIAQQSQLDQAYVLAISIKDLAKSGWESGRTASQWTFDMPAELFTGQSYVRLRGLSLAVVGPPPAPEETALQKPKSTPAPPPPSPKPRGFWSASVSLPPGATVHYASGANDELDQKSLPRCFFGRVADHDSSHAPELAGANFLHNASPIGKEWKLSLAAKSTDGFATSNLDDVILYLHLAVRGQKTEG
jgi:hypothetical protein